MKARPYVVPTLALLLMLVLSPPAAASSTASRCGVTVLASVNCATVSMNSSIDYARCENGGQNGNGIWVYYCPVTWTVTVDTASWIHGGGYNVNFYGWCSPGTHSWTTGTTATSRTHSCEGWPAIAARCDWSDPSWPANVFFRSDPNTDAAIRTHPGQLTVDSSAPRPLPPGGC